MKFTLEITLGNDAMQDPADVAELLEDTARRLRDNGFDAPSFKLFDTNGNTVGRWGISGK